MHFAGDKGAFPMRRRNVIKDALGFSGSGDQRRLNVFSIESPGEDELEDAFEWMERLDEDNKRQRSVRRSISKH